MPEMEEVYLPCSDVAYRKIGGDMILVHAVANRMISLNETGSAIWESLKGVSVGQIIEMLVSSFDIDRKRATEDTIEFLEDLERRRFIELRKND